MDLLTMSNYLV